jgi:hypothetical protein
MNQPSGPSISAPRAYPTYLVSFSRVAWACALQYLQLQLLQLLLSLQALGGITKAFWSRR